MIFGVVILLITIFAVMLVIDVAVALLGLRRAGRPEKYGFFLVWGVVLLVIGVFGALYIGISSLNGLARSGLRRGGPHPLSCGGFPAEEAPAGCPAHPAVRCSRPPAGACNLRKNEVHSYEKAHSVSCCRILPAPDPGRLRRPATPQESPSGAPPPKPPCRSPPPPRTAAVCPPWRTTSTPTPCRSWWTPLRRQYGEEGTFAAMYAEGNELRYDFTIDSLETSEEERAVYAEALQSSTEAGADAYRSTAAELKSMVSNEEVVVVVTFMDGAGNVLYSQSFSSNDAE